MTTPIRVAVTGAGGQIGYAILFRLGFRRLSSALSKRYRSDCWKSPPHCRAPRHAHGAG